MQKLIYIADDDQNIRQLIQSFLNNDGFQTVCFADGISMLSTFEKQKPDLIILDIMMPGLDGLSLCSMIRQNSTIPIIIVSAKDSEADRIIGITLGGDDYLVKPFSPLELVARVKALFRRLEMQGSTDSSQNTLSFGDIQIDLNLHSVSLRSKPFSITPTEYDFLVYMLKNQERAVSKSELLTSLWEFEFEVDTRATDDLVKRLRKKLKDYNSATQIETVWGFGYRLSLRES